MLRAGVSRIIAGRYLLSKKSHSVINLISITTIVAIAVPTAAMMILLSVHNGFEEFIGRLWSSFDSALVVQPAEGKYFNQDSISKYEISKIEGVENISYYIEDDALLRYKERQSIAVIRGVDSAYCSATEIEKIVAQGNADVYSGALVGMGIAYQLGLKVNLSSSFTAIAPSATSYDPFNPSSLYSEMDIELGGVFSLDADRDSRLIFISLEGAQELFSRNNEATALAIAVDANSDISSVKESIENIVGDDFVVKDIYEQNEAEYNLIKSEKVAIYLIILLVMIIASFTLVGAVIMLIIEKRDSMFSLRILGLNAKDIRTIFVWQGLFISIIGAMLGIVIGLGVSLAQQEWGFVPINGASLLIDTYPIRVKIEDTIIVLLSVVSVTFAISWITNKIMIKN